MDAGARTGYLIEGNLPKQKQGKCLGTQKRCGSEAGEITRMQGEIKLMQIQWKRL